MASLKKVLRKKENKDGAYPFGMDKIFIKLPDSTKAGITTKELK